MPQQQNLTIPIAIVVAGALIAGALYFAGGGSGTTDGPTGTTDAKEIPKVTEADHILGDPNAPIKIVEYTDLECPFCKQFHVTMKQIIDEYGKDGQVAWVVRNFPLAQLHPNAPKLAEAAECVAELAGNAAYFTFLDDIFEQAPMNARFDMTKVTETAVRSGATASAFDTCYNSGKYKTKIETEFNDAIATGGQGTPHNIIVTDDGQTIPLPGAQPYATIKSVLEAIISESN